MSVAVVLPAGSYRVRSDTEVALLQQLDYYCYCQPKIHLIQYLNHSQLSPISPVTLIVIVFYHFYRVATLLF